MNAGGPRSSATGVPMRAGRSRTADLICPRTRRAGAILLLSVAGLVACVGMVGTAGAQQLQSTPVYPDDSPQAQGALDRAGELSAAGNIAEAARVIQQLLDTDAERVVPDPEDPKLFVCLRTRANRLLVQSPALLERYRTVEEPRARDQLARGEFVQTERSRLMTRSGLQAALRCAERDLESARFEAARLGLEQLEGHPDRKDPELSTACAAMARRVAQYIGRESVRAWAQRWTTEAGGTEAVGPAIVPPPRAALRSESPVPTGGRFEETALDAESLVKSPLQSVWISEQVRRDLGDAIDLGAREGRGSNQPPGSMEPWVYPTAFGDMVFINDGTTTSAMDRYTLAPIWSVRPKSIGDEVPDPYDPSGEESMFRQGMGRLLEDTVSVAVGGGVAVSCSGLSYASGREDVERIHAFDAATGRELWSVHVARLADGLENSGIRGMPVIEGDTLVVGVKKTGQARRLLGLYLVGLDVRDGSTKWSRLLGSAGVLPRGGSGRIADSPVVSEGIVYRSDEMGLVAAVEAASGRPRWVRTLDPGEPRLRESTGAWSTSTPIIDGKRLLVLSPDHQRLLILDAETGKLLATRMTRPLGDPNYLVKVGGSLACLGDRAVFVDLDRVADGEIRESPVFTTYNPTGRAVAAGGLLLVPTGEGLLQIDPAAPQKPKVLEIAHSGNVVVNGEHLLVTDATRLHSYLVWDKAEKLVQGRISASPRDPRPAITYAELACRAGKSEQLIAAMDTAIRAISLDPGSAIASQSRRDLFELAAVILKRGLAPEPAQSGAPGAAFVESAAAPAGDWGPPIHDLTVLDAVLQRMSRCAESDSEQTLALLLTGSMRQAQGASDRAVAAYQEIIQSPSLSSSAYIAGNMQVRADAEASRLVRELVRVVGPRVYGAFDAEAARALAELGQSPRSAALEDLVRQYPAAAQNAGILTRAGDEQLAAGDASAAATLYERALASAEEAVATGRDELLPSIGVVGGKLAMTLTAQDQPASALRLLKRLSKDYPRLTLAVDGGADAAVRGLEVKVAASSRPAKIGTKLGPDVQALEGWVLVPTMSRERAPAPTEHVLLFSAGNRQLALWGVSGESSGLRKAWTRDVGPTPPLVVRIDSAAALLFWQTPEGGELERVDLADGQSMWRTASFDSMAPAPAGDAMAATDPRLTPVATPLDGPVKLSDLVVALDERTAILAQRGGRVVAIDLASGKPLWTQASAMHRVFDASVGSGKVLLAGANERPRPDGLGSDQIPILRSLDARSGQVLQTVSSPFGHLRWVRVVSEDLAIVGFADAVVGMDLRAGRELWTNNADAARHTLDAWVLGPRLVLMDDERNLWIASATTGKLTTSPIPGSARISEHGPVRAQEIGESIVFAADRGMLVIGPTGELAGMDPLGSLSELVTPVVAERFAVAVDSGLSRQGDTQTFRLMLLDTMSGKLVQQQTIAAYDAPKALAVLDGRIVVTCGAVTLVIPAQ